MKILLSFLVVCLACIACNDAVDLTSINKDLDNRNGTVAPQDIVISPYDPYRWTRLPDATMQIADMDESRSVIFKVNGNVYCYRTFTKIGTSRFETRTYKFNKSTREWQLYQIDLTQFFQNFEYLFSYAQYVYGVAEDKRVGMININTGDFRWMSPFPGISVHDFAAVTIGSNGYVLGGHEYVSPFEAAVNQYWKYDIVRDRWTNLGGLPDGGRSIASAFVVGTKIYYGLGYQGELDDADSFTNDWLALDPSNNTFSRQTNFPGGARGLAKGFVINGKVYVGWGNALGEAFDDFWEFNPEQNRWTEKPNPGTAFTHEGAFSLDNTGYLLSFDNDEFWRYGNPTEVNPIP